MVDVVDTVTRSRMMAGIKGKNSSPELTIRKALHARGFRYRIHVSNLPGKPDLVLSKYKAAVFIHGCFWHGHNCRYFKLPGTRPEFWQEKISKNRARDEQQLMLLRSSGWRVLIIWECAIREMKKSRSTVLIETVADWIVTNSQFLEVKEGLLPPSV
ncbi:very short patch repair endonuclease [Pseudomonas cichorii]|uniref:very short patch repair endonuclease n=1 Tax=Pseudomonas cichorii TaxID=36746 RepID=UPI001910080C|nr:very short patch repair endonuclease [Pseudomonas cichorii]